MSDSYFEVQALDLLPQRLNASCWYASARMLLNWKDNKTHQRSALIPPELDKASQSIRDGNKGILNPQIIPMAKRLGLTSVPAMSVTSHQIGAWLRQYGPLWVNGAAHIVVIGGIRGTMVKVYDPWPVNVGKVNWRSLETWYEGSARSSRDIGAGVQAVFLHC